MTHSFHPSILREYDIRGIVGTTLHEDDAYAIGRSFASVKPQWQTKPPRIAVARDGRLSSPALAHALMRGLSESGAHVIDLGVGPTPMLYFGVCSRDLDGGIMVTGSHNPPTHNGFKCMLGRKSFYGDDIKKLGVIAASGEYHAGSGVITTADVKPEYIKTLCAAYKGTRTLNVAWDAGNGAAGDIMQALSRALPGTHTTLFAEIDGSFPHHHPDPSVAENLQDLIRTVREKHCDIGIAFDGDGDRIGVVDETGAILWGDQLLAIYARDVLASHPGATIIADVKASQTLFDEIARLGGKPLMWKTGHSLIKTKMVQTNALLAGEMSGHIFFADEYFGYDDGLYAAVRILSYLARHDVTLSSLRESLPQTCSTPELRIDCDDARKFAVIDEVKLRLKDAHANVSDIDGVRVNTQEGWWLLRASNTQAAIVARAESTSHKGLESLQAQLRDQLQQSGVAV